MEECTSEWFVDNPIPNDSGHVGGGKGPTQETVFSGSPGT